MIDYDKIPEELRWSRNWLLAGPDKHGRYKAPYSFNSRGIFNVKPTETIHCKDLETIIEASEQYRPCGLGFLLTEKDVYTCIDLDIKNINNYPDKVDHNGEAVEWTSEEDIARFHKIIEKFASYTERSTSGQGFHIWVRGNIGLGCRRDGVEVYSQERFIICTGDIYVNREIEERQELLNILVGEIRSAAAPKIDLIDKEETEPDDVVLERARNAENADKFNKLFSGDWDGYPSQSEADLALCSIFTFYSKSNAQCRRLFRLSKLGLREKATKNDTYLNRTLRLIRSREAVEEEIDASAVAAGKALLASLQAQYAPQHPAPTHAVHPLPQAQTVYQAPQQSTAVMEDDEEFEYPEGLSAVSFNPLLALEPIPEENCVGVPWPPGTLGALAQYIFEGSPRPVKEVSIVAALGFLAGVAGKAFCIPQSGLNIYLVLVAKSAIGKEAMHSGIANICGYISDAIPDVTSFIDFSDYASGPALSKAVASNPSFVNVSGEWGRKLRRLGQEDGRDGPMQQLRTVMTNLYQKSGPKSIVGGIGYSDKEKNIASVSGVAYTMIGETTPKTFYDALTDTMMEDGFLSRFTVIEYTGKRPKDNTATAKKPHPTLLNNLVSIVAQALNLNKSFKTQEVLKCQEAHDLLTAFNEECDAHINNNNDEGFRQMWNRAHLKAYRIAALLAVADNHIYPVIQKEHAEWALLLIRKDIEVMSRRINSGDVGVGDSVRERKVMSIIEKFLRDGAAVSYGVPEKMKENSVVPRKYLQINTQNASSFTSHRNGQNAALDATIRSLIDSGYLVELSKEKAFEQFQFQGKCYRVLSLPKTKQEK